MAKSGRHCVKSLPTTVATPPKKCGRKLSSRPAVAGPSGTIRVAKPSGYIVLTSGCQIRSTASASSLATSVFHVRGYDPKSSVGANWVGLTKIETTTFRARRLASRTSDTWPSWSAPMVGTSAIVAFFTLRPSSARRSAGIVLTIWGLGDIGARSAGFGRQRNLTLRRAGQFYQDRCLVAKQGNAWVGGPTAQAASE